MLNALILFVFVETVAANGTTIQCEFPGEKLSETAIRVELKPQPSLKDQPGLFRVMMKLNGKASFKASAQPIASTAERDVMFRGKPGSRSIYTVGLRDDGTAAFNMKTRDADAVKTQTRLGACHGFETHIERWLPS